MRKFLLLLMIVLCAIGARAQDFDYEYQGQTITYTVVDATAKTCITKAGAASTSGNTVTGTTLVLPANPMNGDEVYTLIGVGDYGFYNQQSLTSVQLPATVNSIGIHAFQSARNLASINIPEGVTTIGNQTFCYCSGLESIVLPASLETIETFAFYQSGLKSVIIPKNVKEIGAQAFQNCVGLTSLSIESGTIGKQAFYGCTSLVDIILKDGIIEIGDQAFRGCSSLVSVSIPNSVTTIGQFAFYECTALTEFVLGNGVTSVATNAFNASTEIKRFAYPNTITKPTLASGVSALGIAYDPSGSVIESGWVYGPGNAEIRYAPYGLEGAIEFPATVTSIAANAFYGCAKITSAVIPEGVTSIGQYGFRECPALTYAVIPNSVTEIGTFAFYQCEALEEVVIGNGMDSMVSSIFSKCTGVKKYAYPNTYTSKPITAGTGVAYNPQGSVIEAGWVYGPGNAEVRYAPYSLNGEVTLPSTVTSIADNAFYDCVGVTTVTFPEGLATIGDNAFRGCVALTSVSFPASVTAVGSYAYYDCKAITDTEYASIEALCNINFTNWGSNPSYYSRIIKVNGSEVTEIEVPDGVTAINCTFPNVKNLTFVKIPNSVTSISPFSFYYCIGLKKVVLPGSLTSIGDQTWKGCSSLEAIEYLTEEPVVANANVFDDSTYSSAKLYALDSAKDKIEATVPWSSFATTEYVSLVLNKSEAEVTEGETLQLAASYGEGVTEVPVVTWSTSDEAVATVNETGLVTAVAPGTATITAKTANGKEATCAVTVTKKIILAEGITLNKTEAEIVEGETLQLEATVAPETTTDKTVTWSSSDEAVATVSEAGLVTAVAPGTATITVKTANGKEATCAVTIAKKIILAEGITLNKTEAEIVEGETLQLEATVAPETTTDKTVTWSTSDEAIATVSEAGLVTAVAPGTVTITAKTTNGKEATCAVTVTKKIILAEGITLNKTEAEIVEGETLQLEATIAPETTTDKTVTWSSSDEAIATVSETGLVTAVAPGTATITAKTANGKEAACAVTVTKKIILPESISLIRKTLSLEEGKTTQLKPIITPDEVTEKTVTWTSSNEAVATVSETGLVTAVAQGKATITVKTVNNLEATCALTVVERNIPAEGITLDKTEAEITEGKKLHLEVTLTPEDATEHNLTWTSSDEAVATVDEDGMVTAVAPGKATITVTTSNNLSASCVVTVVAKVILAEGITLNKTEAEIVEGETLQLEATVSPETTTDKTVTWSSSDEAIATVSETGLVTAVAPGTATITAKTANGKEATCAVTVAKKIILAEGITLNKTEAEIVEGETLQLEATVAPETTTDKTVTWSSSDEAVATVSAAGLVTAVAPGTATITAKTANGKEATCAVVVSKKIIAVESITLNTNATTIKDNETFQLTATVTPDDATDKQVAWTTSDATIAEVSSTGLVTAHLPGTVTITATTVNGLTATCVVTVTKFAGINGVYQTGDVKIIGNSVEAPEGSRIYDLSGREARFDNLDKGIYIVVLPEGKGVKIAIR